MFNSPKRPSGPLLGRFIRDAIVPWRFRTGGSARARLMPLLKSRVDVEFALQHAPIQERFPFELVGNDLALTIIHEPRRGQPTTVTHQQLRSWAMTFDDALQLAGRNLAARRIVFQPLDSVYVFAARDGYDATRLLMAESLLESLGSHGAWIAAIPHPNLCVIGDAEDETSLEQTVALLMTGLEQKERISFLAFQLSGDEWHTWLPPITSQSYQRFKWMRTVEMAVAYQRQADHKQAPNGEAPAVEWAKIDCIKDLSDDLVTCCWWSQGDVSLLPKTDLITVSGARNPGGIATCRWDDVMQVAGRLFKPQGWYLERYFVSGFPTECELEELSRVRVSP